MIDAYEGDHQDASMEVMGRESSTIDTLQACILQLPGYHRHTFACATTSIVTTTAAMRIDISISEMPHETINIVGDIWSPTRY